MIKQGSRNRYSNADLSYYTPQLDPAAFDGGFSHARRKYGAVSRASTEYPPLPVALEDAPDDDRARIPRTTHRRRGSGTSPTDGGIQLAHGSWGELARMAGRPRRSARSVAADEWMLRGPSPPLPPELDVLRAVVRQTPRQGRLMRSPIGRR